MALYKWDTKVAWMWVVDISWKQDKATSGSTAPSTTPSYVGQMYVDTTNGILYTAKWTSSSSDWLEVWAWWGNVIAMTQAEYDALSAAEKADGKLRIITDAPAIDISWWFEPEDSGTTWQVLKKTDTWYNWGNIDSMATAQPSNPVAGSSYYDTTNNVIKVYNWTTWEDVGWGGDVPQATTEVVGTVRWATDTEIKNHTNKWSNNELLVMTPYTFRRNVKFSIDYNQSWSSGWPKYSTTISSAGQSTTLTIDNNSYIRYKSGILIIEWDEYIFNGASQNTLTIENEDNHYWYSPISFYEKLESCSVKVGGTTYYPEMKIHHRDLVYISWQWDPTFTLTNDWTSSSITWKSNRIVATWFITLTPSVD